MSQVSSDVYNKTIHFATKNHTYTFYKGNFQNITINITKKLYLQNSRIIENILI